jgi:hypothetical protein
MPPPLLHAPALQQALAVLQPPRLRQRIEAALAEEEAYAADELVELAEELLHHLAAVGIAHYLWKAPQKEVYNDFLLQLFNGGGHDLNAGPLYRWAANMVRECPAMEASPLRAFFWERTADGREVLAARVNRLSDLRNQVMHGFFNAAHTLPHPSSVPTPAQRRTAMHNVLRFKGPFADRSEDRAEVEDLHHIVDLLCGALQQGRTVVAHRFAEEHQLPIEPMHEAFTLLAPWVHPGRIPFAEDAVHELYGYPLDLTEASPIYLALGRRDLTLEYQHRILAP